MRILSGFQPSGTLHLGNYFGAMLPNLDFQKMGESYLFIADYHALTTSPEPEALRQRVFDVALDFLACGLDAEHTVFFRQSDVPEVTELMWILNTICWKNFVFSTGLSRCPCRKSGTTHLRVYFRGCLFYSMNLSLWLSTLLDRGTL